MQIKIIKCLQDNYSYIIIDNNNACVVDPSESDPVIKYLEENKINLKFILNTHHHYDHVGGNKELKKKYNAKVLGYINDKERIPEIDIFLKNKEIWNTDSFKFQIFHIPGHTSGHICYYFKNEKFLFTGDTLFSLGCGRIFEGTYEQMFKSLTRLKEISKETKIYCGHEYTLQNSNFCMTIEPHNLKLKEKIIEIRKKIKNNLPTIPSILGDELECNIFLKAKDVKSFSKLRDLKDNF